MAIWDRAPWRGVGAVRKSPAEATAASLALPADLSMAMVSKGWVVETNCSATIRMAFALPRLKCSPGLTCCLT